MRPKRVPTDEEFARLVNYAKSRRHRNAPRDRAFLATLGLVGARVSEVIAFRFGDLLFDENPPQIVVGRLKKKESVNENVALPPSAVVAIKAYMRELGPGEKERHMRLFPFTRQRARKLLRHYAEKAGVVRYSPHSMRHYRATSVWKATRDTAAVKDALGHANLSTTERYIHTLTQHDKIASVDTLGDVSE